MKSPHFGELVKQALDKLDELVDERAAINVEIGKLRQFAFATIPLLNERERLDANHQFKTIMEKLKSPNERLSDAVWNTLDQYKSMTATEVRDRLESKGFDFSHYRTNPLASISTTLKRMAAKKEGMVEESANKRGVATYRLKD